MSDHNAAPSLQICHRLNIVSASIRRAKDRAASARSSQNTPDRAPVLRGACQEKDRLFIIDK